MFCWRRWMSSSAARRAGARLVHADCLVVWPSTIAEEVNITTPVQAESSLIWWFPVAEESAEISASSTFTCVPVKSSQALPLPRHHWDRRLVLEALTTSSRCRRLGLGNPNNQYRTGLQLRPFATTLK